MIFREYSDIVENNILIMPRFLDVSRFLYSVGWRVCVKLTMLFTTGLMANLNGFIDSLLIYCCSRGEGRLSECPGSYIL